MICLLQASARLTVNLKARQGKAKQGRIGDFSRLSATDFARLRSRLYDVINLEQDQELFIPLCGKCVNAIESLGRPTEAVDAKDVVVVV